MINDKIDGENYKTIHGYIEFQRKGSAAKGEVRNVN